MEQKTNTIKKLFFNYFCFKKDKIEEENMEELLREGEKRREAFVQSLIKKEFEQKDFQTLNNN